MQKWLNEIEHYEPETLAAVKLVEYVKLSPRAVAEIIGDEDSVWDSDDDCDRATLPLWMLDEQLQTVPKPRVEAIKTTDNDTLVDLVIEKEGSFEEAVPPCLQPESVPAQDSHPLIHVPSPLSLFDKDDLFTASPSTNKRTSVLDDPQPVDMLDSPMPDHLNAKLAAPVFSDGLQVSECRDASALSVARLFAEKTGEKQESMASWFKPLKAFVEEVGTSLSSGGGAGGGLATLNRSETRSRVTRKRISKRASFLSDWNSEVYLSDDDDDDGDEVAVDKLWKKPWEELIGNIFG